jgi:Ca-activated chloride channel family protein
LEDICTKIAVELKNQYILSYKSTNVAKDGKWRKIKVQVDGPKGVGRLNVRFKGGYYAAVGEPGPGGNKK